MALIEFVADYFVQATSQNRLTVACTEEWYDAKGEKHIINRLKETGATV